MNLILPVFLIAAILMSGVPTITSRIGGVLPGSPAERAGLREGDRVVAVGGRVDLALGGSRRRSCVAPGDRAARARRSSATAQKRELAARARAAEPTASWTDPGLSWHAPAARVGVSDPDSAGRAGGRAHRRPRSSPLNGQPIANFVRARARCWPTLGRPFELELARPLDGETRDRAHDRARARRRAEPSRASGLVAGRCAHRRRRADQPGEVRGPAAGDVVLPSTAALATSDDTVKNLIWGSGGTPIELDDPARRRASSRSASTPTERPMAVDGGTETHWGIGVSLGPSDEGAEYRDDVVRNPFVALARGASRTGEIFVMIVGGIAQLVTGHVGMSSLSGPIGIGEIAADAYQASWDAVRLADGRDQREPRDPEPAADPGARRRPDRARGGRGHQGQPAAGARARRRADGRPLADPAPDGRRVLERHRAPLVGRGRSSSRRWAEARACCSRSRPPPSAARWRCSTGERAARRGWLDAGERHAAIAARVPRPAARAGADAALAEVERIALAIGPGSFTGLRIGLATALGLAFGTDRQLVPVPTLAALATAGRVARGAVAPILDARRGEVYAGLYRRGRRQRAAVGRLVRRARRFPREPARATRRSPSWAAASSRTAPSIAAALGARARVPAGRCRRVARVAASAGSACASPRRACPSLRSAWSCAICAAPRPRRSAWLYTRSPEPIP